MPQLSTIHQPLVGAGKAHIADYSAAGIRSLDEQYLGASQNITATITPESIQQFTGETGLAVLTDETQIQLLRAFALTIANISIANLARFYIGDIAAIAQAAGSTVDEPLTVKQDRFYQLGDNPALSPSGVRGISNVVVTGAGGTPTYAVNVDYTVDLATARLYIMPGGAIADDTDILVDYDTDANTRDRIAAVELRQQTVSFRYIAANVKGAHRDIWVPKASMIPSGDAVIKAIPQVYAELGFNISVLQPDDPNLAPLYIDGRAA